LLTEERREYVFYVGRVARCGKRENQRKGLVENRNWSDGEGIEWPDELGKYR